ncbi:hypothetical protein VTH06DRAFT_7053 [Thermothelomyces fergusii]
MLTYFY